MHHLLHIFSYFLSYGQNGDNDDRDDNGRDNDEDDGGYELGRLRRAAEACGGAHRHSHKFRRTA